MSAARETDYDVVIVGGGLVGLTAAIALTQLGKSVAVVDTSAAPVFAHDWANKLQHWDTRIYALTRQTVHWLEAIGVWAQVPATRVNPIAAMHLWSPSQAHVQPDLTLAADDANLSDMGCIVESQALLAACWQVLQTTDVRCYHNAQPLAIASDTHTVTLTLDASRLTARLLLGADGARSWVRQQCGIDTEQVDFAQTALVTNYHVEYAHGNIARQWFGAHETLALLPMPQQQVSLVWALPAAEAEAQLAQGAPALADAVAARAGRILGALKPAGELLTFPLRQQTATVTAQPMVLLLGDAAHQVHPMAGQGVNLGFQDVMALCQAMQDLPKLKPIGDAGFLQHVARSRKTDVLKMHALTRGLDALFSRPQAVWTHGALLGLRGVQNSAMLKQFLIHTATGS